MQKLFGGARHVVPPVIEAAPETRIEDAEHVLALARRRVRGGYHKRSRIIGEVAELVAEEGLDFDPVKVVDVAISEHRTEQVDWPVLTDFDRLQTAMDAMEDKGIVARDNFLCCSNCGVNEIGYEIEEFRKAGRAARGYAFFHEQDTEAAVDGGMLYLDYGNAERDYHAGRSRQIGQEVAKTLEAAGLKVEWNGDLERRVGVRMDWLRRWEQG